MSKEAQSQEHQVSVNLANLSDLDKREEQKIEVYALMAFRNTRVLEADGFSGQLRRSLHSSQNPGYGHLAFIKNILQTLAKEGLVPNRNGTFS
ncbi:hypothetical protein AXG93_1543s1620 [Marchantia polymorpha subsp. ruderalis]|uniref:Uncharacterized protein n=1 Tax=Marchantia polymorpha subsp. ruderalis TaxID=1480154 RepID=A0A176VZC7_MARPO|nr:hypothetical protein AXG93_1543s1620 [Marchantia polymorpha subsp. ruderalis]